MKKIDQILECHPLAPFIVLEAVRRYTEEVAQSSPEDYPKQWIFHPDSWIQSAKDIQEVITG
jgi:hypothetical protein